MFCRYKSLRRQADEHASAAPSHSIDPHLAAYFFDLFPYSY
jgi:hypothetical protein